jgi:cytochrome c
VTASQPTARNKNERKVYCQSERKLVAETESGRYSFSGALMNGFQQTLQTRGIELRRTKTAILQINVGKLCNLTCNHCHVNAGPKRKEIMTRATIDRVITWLAQTEIPTVRYYRRRSRDDSRFPIPNSAS